MSWVLAKEQVSNSRKLYSGRQRRRTEGNRGGPHASTLNSRDATLRGNLFKDSFFLALAPACNALGPHTRLLQLICALARRNNPTRFFHFSFRKEAQRYFASTSRRVRTLGECPREARSVVPEGAIRLQGQGWQPCEMSLERDVLADAKVRGYPLDGAHHRHGALSQRSVLFMSARRASWCGRGTVRQRVGDDEGPPRTACCGSEGARKALCDPEGSVNSRRKARAASLGTQESPRERMRS